MKTPIYTGSTSISGKIYHQHNRNSMLLRNFATKAFKKRPFKWSTGTPLAQEAINHTLLQIPKSCTIQHIPISGGVPQPATLDSLLKDINLDTHGLIIASQRGESVLLKSVEAQYAMSRYSQQLAKLKEEEMSAKGFKKTSSKAPKKEKIVKISWNCSAHDLKTKFKNISGLVKKGSVVIWLDSKDSLSYDQPKAGKMDSTKREFVDMVIKLCDEQGVCASLQQEGARCILKCK